MHGDLRAAMRLNLESRLAQRVLWPLAHGPYASEHDLYDLARSVRWVDWITPRQTLRVDASATRSPLKSLNFAGLRIKVMKRPTYLVRYRYAPDATAPPLEREMKVRAEDYDTLARGAPLTVLFDPARPRRSVAYQLGDYQAVA